ncbi:MAG TPA: hypothetical protein VIM69_05400 [Opitutaceae bacterium]
MNLDLITSIELTASASVLIAGTALLLGRTTRIRFSITAVLVLWFTWAVSLAASPFFNPENPFGAPGLGLSVVVPIIAFSFAVSRISELKEALRSTSIMSLVALNILRALGVGFLLLKYQGRVAPLFANSAGWGDISVGLLAMPLTWALATRKPGTTGLVWLWNCLGLLDLITAIGLGVTTSPGPLQLIVEPGASSVMTTLPWFLIPGFLVPLFILTHLAIFWRLTRTADRTGAPERFQPAIVSVS